MRKEIAILLVAAVLLLGGVAAVFESVTADFWNIPAFDPGIFQGGNPVQPNGDPIPPAPL